MILSIKALSSQPAPPLRDSWFRKGLWRCEKNSAIGFLTIFFQEIENYELEKNFVR